MDTISPLQRLAAHYKSFAAVARLLGVTRGAVTQWEQGVPLHHAMKLELLSGRALLAEDLCPSEADLLSRFKSGKKPRIAPVPRVSPTGETNERRVRQRRSGKERRASA